MMRTLILEEPVALASPVVTVCTFDGIHIGHASVIESTIERARISGGTSVVVTFDPHPRQFIDPENAPGILTSFEEKQKRLKDLGLDVLAVVCFDNTLRQMTPEAFVETFLVGKLKAKTVIVGYDHGFGKDRQGGFETMKNLGNRHGFSVLSPPAAQVGNKPVSSTRIRKALERGDLEAVMQLMGRPYPIWGRVVSGDGRGKSLGFPTANLSFETPGKILPPFGVYAGRVLLDEMYFAVINYGKRPTFGGREACFEVHLLDLSQDIYGQNLELEICHRIRGECEFESKEALVEQIQSDIQTARQVFSQSNTTLLRR